jgi:hypothetical protein
MARLLVYGLLNWTKEMLRFSIRPKVFGKHASRKEISTPYHRSLTLSISLKPVKTVLAFEDRR